MNEKELVNCYKKIVNNYIHAKDNNKPHLMQAAFVDSATLKMDVKTDKISFPAESVGLEAVTNVLVRDFSQRYENVYTFCVSDSLEGQKGVMSCKWLVGMSEKDSGDVRVGYGRYDWHFSDEGDHLANHLTITIEKMLVLTPEYTAPVMAWLGQLPYPFCHSDIIFENIPDIGELKLMRQYL